jgi:hypothetical protein
VDKLISFVMSNFYIVIVVIGIIYSMFFRKSPLERPRNQMPDFGGNGQQRLGRPAASRPTVVPPTRSEPQEARFPAPQRQNPPPAQSPERQATISRPTVVVSQPSLRAMDRLDARGLTRDDLSRAVLWAEILGPPRARRPHRR